MSDSFTARIINIIKNNWRLFFIIILLLNFALRLIIFSKTSLFNLLDYKDYLSAVDIIHYEKSNIPVGTGNSLFTISYIGYFAKYILGNISYFFILNCILGTMTTFIVSIMIFNISGSGIGAVVTAIILTFYTEFMVFSSVFYTPVIMLFLLALFTISLYYYYTTTSILRLILFSAIILIVFIITFFFKPELVFFPIFLFFLSLAFIKKQRFLFQRSIILVLILFGGILSIKATGIYNRSENNAIKNDFVFFGHTDYGGDGGEGSLIFPGNKARYNEAWADYRKEKGIIEPTIKDQNRFQLLEIEKFITQHPIKWLRLQFTKFFRTFGVVPETTSFLVLYTGLLRSNLWFTSIIVVAPVALIIILFILFFDMSSFQKLFNSSTFQPLNSFSHPVLRTPHSAPTTSQNKPFLFVYFLLFFYYIIAIIFFGQYQERYRMPVMIVFIIPLLGYFISKFDRKQFFNRISLSLKCVIIVFFITLWMFQAKKAISNKERLNNAIESVEEVIK